MIRRRSPSLMRRQFPISVSVLPQPVQSVRASSSRQIFTHGVSVSLITSSISPEPGKRPRRPSGVAAQSEYTRRAERRAGRQIPVS